MPLSGVFTFITDSTQCLPPTARLAEWQPDWSLLKNVPTPCCVGRASSDIMVWTVAIALPILVTSDRSETAFRFFSSSDPGPTHSHNPQCSSNAITQWWWEKSRRRVIRRRRVNRKKIALAYQSAMVSWLLWSIFDPALETKNTLVNAHAFLSMSSMRETNPSSLASTKKCNSRRRPLQVWRLRSELVRPGRNSSDT